MAQYTQKRLRFWVLIILGCTFLIIVPIHAATDSTRSAVTTPQEQPDKRPNPLRRFFSWMTEAVKRPFRKRVPPISEPPTVHITSSTSMISFCPRWMRSIGNCSASHEVELSASSPDADVTLLYAWAVSAGRIRGEGQKVIWDLSDVAEGTYTANVEVNDGTGLTASASTKVTIALCQSCITSLRVMPAHSECDKAKNVAGPRRPSA